MRVIHRAPVEESTPQDAIVSLPGPLLCDVQARLRQPEPKPRAFDLLADVRASLEDEAQTRIAPDTMDFARDDDAKEQDDVVTRHRFDPPEAMPHAESSAPSGARRLVVLRDRRMGRPRNASLRHGADPPR
jgi:hypothetical protein